MRSNLNRIAGLAITVGVLTYLVTITLYLTFYGEPGGTGEEGMAPSLSDRVGHYLANRAFIEGLWRTEILATLCLAFGGFGLAGRKTAGPKNGFAGAGWLLVGIGATIMVLMFPFMLGGYPAAAEAATETIAIFAVLQESMLLLFYFSNFTVFLGLGLSFFSEAHRTGSFPRWLTIAGTVLCLYSGAVFLGLFFGAGSLMLAGPPSLAAYVLTAALGVQIARFG